MKQIDLKAVTKLEKKLVRFNIAKINQCVTVLRATYSHVPATVASVIRSSEYIVIIAYLELIYGQKGQHLSEYTRVLLTFLHTFKLIYWDIHTYKFKFRHLKHITNS